MDLYRGDTYAWRFRMWEDTAHSQPLDLSEATAKAEIRDKPGGNTIMDLACTVELPNVVMVRLDAEDWDQWTLKKAAWDLQLTWPGPQIVTVVAGPVAVTPDVTDSTVIATGSVLTR